MVRNAACLLSASMCAGALAFAASCLGPAEPCPFTKPVAVLGAESGRAYLVSASCTSPSVLPTRFPRFLDAFAVTPDSAVVYVTGFDSSDPARYLFALDLRSLRLLWRRDLAEIAGRGTVDGLTLLGNYALAVSRDRTRLIVNAEREGVPGLASISLETLEPLAFHGPFATPPDGTAPVGPGIRAPAGAIAVVGTRQTSERPTAGMLLLLSPDLVPVDSAVLVRASEDRWGAMRQLTNSPDGDVAYISTADSILAYSLSARRIASRTERPSQGWITVDPEGNRLYLTDPGDGRDWPGTGLVFVFDQTLNALPSLDLRSALANGAPPVTNRAVPAAEPRVLYVTSGTASRGPLYGPQPAHVLVVDAGSGALRQAIPLNDWGKVRAFPIRE